MSPLQCLVHFHSLTHTPCYTCTNTCPFLSLSPSQDLQHRIFFLLAWRREALKLVSLHHVCCWRSGEERRRSRRGERKTVLPSSSSASTSVAWRRPSEQDVCRLCICAPVELHFLSPVLFNFSFFFWSSSSSTLSSSRISAKNPVWCAVPVCTASVYWPWWQSEPKFGAFLKDWWSVQLLHRHQNRQQRQQCTSSAPETVFNWGAHLLYSSSVGFYFGAPLYIFFCLFCFCYFCRR